MGAKETMKTINYWATNFIFLLISCSLCGCLSTQKELEEKQLRIDRLEKENQSLKEKNLDFLAQNKRLKYISEEVLGKLAKIQAQQEELIRENMELYQKLYQDRMGEQKMLMEERKQQLKDLSREASSLVKEITKTKDDLKAELYEKRDQLRRMDLWRLEDERQLQKFIATLMKNNLPPAEEKRVLFAAIEIGKTLQERIDKGSRNPLP